LKLHTFYELISAFVAMPPCSKSITVVSRVSIADADPALAPCFRTFSLQAHLFDLKTHSVLHNLYNMIVVAIYPDAKYTAMKVRVSGARLNGTEISPKATLKMNFCGEYDIWPGGPLHLISYQ
jgi:hypothetical protein